MIYTKEEFAQGLMKQLRKGYDANRIAKWAYAQYIGARSIESGLEPIILKVTAMGEGPEFEIPEEELKRIAAELVE